VISLDGWKVQVLRSDSRQLHILEFQRVAVVPAAPQ
jgi:hypothetical protein